MELPLIETNRLGMKLALVVPGEFWMGSDSGNAPVTERPQHRVRIGRPFYCGVYEVTVGEYGQYIAEGGARVAGDWRPPRGFSQSDRHPVVGVSWNDAKAFCQWLSRREQATYRLPSEAEWEFACGYKSGGTEQTPGTAWFGGNSEGRTHRVGLLEPNELGIYDFLGNVKEWCLDGIRQYTGEPVDNPLGPADGPRVLRGGDWSSAKLPRASQRGCAAVDHSDDKTGFRVVLEVAAE
jgi:formylglycine-generating enzyme required for sulfatase activity